MAALIGPRSLLIEYGSGSGLKTRLLLDHLQTPLAYVPVEISREALQESTQALHARYPGLHVLPVMADYTSHYQLPQPPGEPASRVVFFPGSTIGNFEPEQAARFMRHIASTVDKGGALLVGVDLHKDTLTLERAYDDAAGITAAFELETMRFAYRSWYNEERQRIEMYLESLEAQRVRVAGSEIAFEKSELILIEYSQKYTLESFRRFAAAADFTLEQVWLDDRSFFSIQYLRRA